MQRYNIIQSNNFIKSIDVEIKLDDWQGKSCSVVVKKTTLKSIA